MGIHHDHNGKFRKGNTAGAGHAAPHAATVATLRAALLASVTPADVAAVVRRILNLTADPDGRVALAAAELLLDRLFGRAVAPVAVDVTTGPAGAVVNLAGLSDAERVQLEALTLRALAPAPPAVGVSTAPPG